MQYKSYAWFWFLSLCKRREPLFLGSAQFSQRAKNVLFVPSENVLPAASPHEQARPVQTKGVL